MEIKDAILTRRTIRTYSEKEVDTELIKEVINMAIHAPSASNRQAWKFIVVDSQEVKNQICSYNGFVMKNGYKLIKEAPVGIITLYRNDVSKNYKEYKDHVQSASAAIQNLLLSAHSKGLGSCWICKLPTQRKMRRLLDIPKHYDVISYVTLGYPKEYISEHTLRHYDGNIEKAMQRSRKYSVDEVICYNRFTAHDNSKGSYKSPWFLSKLHYLQLLIKQNEKETVIYKVLKGVFKLVGVKF